MKDEELDCNQISHVMMGFSNFIRLSNLVDLQLEGDQFTCSNNHALPTMSILDRFFITMEWEEYFPKTIQQLHFKTSLRLFSLYR